MFFCMQSLEDRVFFCILRQSVVLNSSCRNLLLNMAYPVSTSESALVVDGIRFCLSVAIFYLPLRPECPSGKSD